MTDQAFSEFSELVTLRDHAAYRVTGAAIVSVCYLNLNDPNKAHLALFEAVAEYQQAAEKVEAFHRNQVRKQTQSAKENQDGNASKSAA